jgi:hypothetical protein
MICKNRHHRNFYLCIHHLVFKIINIKSTLSKIKQARSECPVIKDYEVFEPNNERLAQIIVRILREKDYIASYQLGYPKNKVFIRIEDKQEADRVSVIIKRFMEKISLTEMETTADKLSVLISDLGRSLSKTTTEIEPEIVAVKVEKPIVVEQKEIVTEKTEKELEKKNMDSSKILETEAYHTAILEEWRSKIIERAMGRIKIIERLNLLNTQMKENPNDPTNEKRKIERDTLAWILQNTPD